MKRPAFTSLLVFRYAIGKGICFAGVAFWVLLLSPQLAAEVKTHYVWFGLPSYEGLEDTYPTINDALEAAGEGDTIYIYRPLSGGSHFLSDASKGDQYNVTVDIDNLTIEGHVYPGNQLVVIDGNSSVAQQEVPPRFYGFDIRLGQGVTVRNLEIRNCHWAGVRVGPNADDAKITNVTFDANVFYGLEVDGDHAMVTGCKFNGTTKWNGGAAGCYVTKGTGCKLENCLAFDNKQDGFFITFETTNVTMNNCTSDDNDRQGLRTHNMSGLTITNSYFTNNGASGIQIESGTDDVVIKGVESYGNNTDTDLNGEAGIWIDCSSNCLVEDCLIYDNATGIRIDADENSPVGPDYSDNNIVRFNRIFDNDKEPTLPTVVTSFNYWRVRTLAIYHNTFWNNGTTTSPVNEGRGGFVTRSSSSVNSRVSFVNIVLGKQVGASNSSMVRINDTDEIEDLDSNVYFQPPTDMSYYVESLPRVGFDAYQDKVGIDEDNSVESEYAPIYNSSHRPITNRDAHNTAGALTKATGHAGGGVVVENAAYFRVEDVIITSQDVTAEVLAVNYATNTVTFDDTVYVGDLIYLARTGNSGVDIGCVQN